MKKPSYKDVLPEYPSIRHLPWRPNSKGDRIATEEEAAVIFTGPRTCIQEKLDGANCGMAWLNGHPVVRTRTKILRKGQELRNPSQAQFASVWNWMHENKRKFVQLSEHGPYSVYGEFMVQQHGMEYDALPDWFVAYDLYDWDKGFYLDPWEADLILEGCGFWSVPISFYSDPRLGGMEILPGPNPPVVTSEDHPLTYEFLEEIANYPSQFANNKQREGIVVKVSDGKQITAKFKMVRQGFDQGCLLGDEIKRNKLRIQNEREEKLFQDWQPDSSGYRIRRLR